VTAAELKALSLRKADAMARHPGFARASAQAHARVGDGFAHDLTQDAHELMGASLAADLAMGYRLWAARLDVAIECVDVDVVVEWDARGQMGLDCGAAIGWDRVLFDVTIASAAAEADVRRVVETADRLSPLLANLAPAIRRIHRLTLAAPRR
jgi:hypothetical protein